MSAHRSEVAEIGEARPVPEEERAAAEHRLEVSEFVGVMTFEMFPRGTSQTIEQNGTIGGAQCPAFR